MDSLATSNPMSRKIPEACDTLGYKKPLCNRFWDYRDKDRTRNWAALW
jgi:hypothetical protein